MLVKSGLEVKSRWNLDDFEGDDPNLSVINTCSVPEAVRTFLEGCTAVHVLHPRLAAVAKAARARLVGKIRVEQTTTINSPQFTEFDDEDYVPEPVTHSIAYSVLVSQINGFGLIELPPVDIELCGTLAKELVPLLARAVVYSPGQVYAGGSIATMGTATGVPLDTGLPLALPPSHTQGVTAALASCAERLGKPMTIILVHADGPAGHEVMHHYDIAAIQQLLLRTLSVTPAAASEPDISALYL